MRRRHVTLRGGRADSQVALVIPGTSEITPAAQSATSALEMVRYVMIAVVRCKFIFSQISTLFFSTATIQNYSRQLKVYNLLQIFGEDINE